MDVGVDFLWFFNALNLIQHLFAAFSTFDRFLAVERTKLFNYGFLMFDFLLLV